MSRFCKFCQKINTFFRMKEKTIIYCSVCLRAIEVTEREADWFQEDT